MEFLGEGDAKVVHDDQHSCNAPEALTVRFQIVNGGTSAHLMSRCLEESIVQDCGGRRVMRKTEGKLVQSPACRKPLVLGPSTGYIPPRHTPQQSELPLNFNCTSKA